MIFHVCVNVAPFSFASIWSSPGQMHSFDSWLLYAEMGIASFIVALPILSIQKEQVVCTLLWQIRLWCLKLTGKQAEERYFSIQFFPPLCWNNWVSGQNSQRGVLFKRLTMTLFIFVSRNNKFTQNFVFIFFTNFYAEPVKHWSVDFYGNGRFISYYIRRSCRTCKKRYFSKSH